MTTTTRHIPPGYPHAPRGAANIQHARGVFIAAIGVVLSGLVTGCFRAPRLHRGLSDDVFDARVRARIREQDSSAKVKRVMRTLDVNDVRESSVVLEPGWRDADSFTHQDNADHDPKKSLAVVRGDVNMTLGHAIQSAIVTAGVDTAVNLPFRALALPYPTVEANAFAGAPIELIVVLDVEERALAAFETVWDGRWRRIHLRGPIRRSNDALLP